MAAILFDEGLADCLGRKYAQTPGLALATVRLYTAISPAISKASVKANFTEVGAVMGYVAKTIGAADFAFVTDTTLHNCIATATYTWTFTAGAGLTILGYFVTNSGNSRAGEGEQFATAITIPAGGGTLQIQINDQYQAC
jgi:hypothetical protein